MPKAPNSDANFYHLLGLIQAAVLALEHAYDHASPGNLRTTLRTVLTALNRILHEA